MPTDRSTHGASDYDRIKAAIRYLEARAEAQPDLEEVARAIGLSPFHFQRLFRRWAGVSPKQFLKALTIARARELLASKAGVLDTALAVGLSGPSRLHDLFVTIDAVTPGEWKSGGSGLELVTGFHPTPFGNCLIAMTERGICALTFFDREGKSAEREELDSLARAWPRAKITEDLRSTKRVVRRIFSREAGRSPEDPIHLHLRGTNFQLKVWEALLRIPPGSIASYHQVAEAIGRPSASRAVGHAIGSNSVAYLIPCHRVLKKTGAIGEYRWGGPARKAAMLAWESAAIEASDIEDSRIEAS